MPGAINTESEKTRLLKRFSFWDNQDWQWYRANIPFWESPDPVIDEIYYYRWEVVTKHLRYASPEVGYVFTEWLNAVGYSGSFGPISCPAALQLREARWLADPRYAMDFCRYWFKAPGARPLAYSWSAGWALMSVYEAVGARMHDLLCAFLHPLTELHEQWKAGKVGYPTNRGYDPKRGLFWNTGRDSSGEGNLASMQLSETLSGINEYKVRGGAGYRPDINADMYGDLVAIGKIAAISGHRQTADKYLRLAEDLRRRILEQLWDADRQFFMHRWRYDQYGEGDTAGQPGIKAGSLIWETNKNRHGGTGFQPEKRGAGKGRELTGYVPWYYRLPYDDDSGNGVDYSSAWRYLMDPNYFYGEFGPTTAERNDPWFAIIYDDCRFNGNSWPLNTSKVLVAAANLLNDYKSRRFFSRADFFTLLKNYARTHYKDGKPYLAESHDPDRDQWTVDRLNGRHYFHSCFIDIIITGLAGLRPREDNVLEINPLVPEAWDYFALRDVPYHGRKITVLWDRQGKKYGHGQGLMVFSDGELMASLPKIGKLTAELPGEGKNFAPLNPPRLTNYAVNNEGKEYPKLTASYTAQADRLEEINNGLYWYHREPHNRWTCRGTWRSEDWVCVDFGSLRSIDAVRLYIWEGRQVAAPAAIRVQYISGGQWKDVAELERVPTQPTPRRGNLIRFERVNTQRIRVILKHRKGYASGLVEFEALQVEGEMNIY